MSGFSSILSLATVTFSPRSLEISSSAGAIIRHGPHHSAQKSTRTGPSAPSTSVAKLWSVTVLVPMAANLLRGFEKLTTIWVVPLRPSRRKLEQLRPGGVKQRCSHGPVREDDLKRFDIGVHLGAVCDRNCALVRRNAASLEVEHRDLTLLDQ